MSSKMQESNVMGVRDLVGDGGGGGKKGGNHGDTLMRKKVARGKAKKNGTLYPSATVQIIKPMAKT